MEEKRNLRDIENDIREITHKLLENLVFGAVEVRTIKDELEKLYTEKQCRLKLLSTL